MKRSKLYAIATASVIVLGGCFLALTLDHNHTVEFIPTKGEISALTAEEERDLTRKATDDRDPNAAYRLYEYFEFTRKDKPMADHWWKVAGELGDPAAKAHP